MPLPPKGDPRRALHLAIRSTRVLGALFVLLGLAVLAVPTLYLLRGGAAGAGPMVVYLGIASLVYHLARSFEAIAHPPFGEEVRGFEPLPVPPVAGGGPDAAPPGW